MKNNNIFLAQLVSFSQNSLLFRRNELENDFNAEDFRLVELRGNWAYDLINYKRYFLITNAEGFIDDRVIDKLRANIYYAYKLWEFVDIWEEIKIVYGIEKSLEQFLEDALDMVEEVDETLNTDNNVIDFKKIKKLVIQGK